MAGKPRSGTLCDKHKEESPSYSWLGKRMWLICWGSESRQTHIIQSHRGTMRLAKLSILLKPERRLRFWSVTLREFSLCCSDIEPVTEVDFYSDLFVNDYGTWLWDNVLLHMLLLDVFVPDGCHTRVFSDYGSHTKGMLYIDSILYLTLLWAGSWLSWAMDWLSFACCWVRYCW